MLVVELGFNAFDPHELLCHALAVRAGHYAGEGLRVRLVDATFMSPAPDGLALAGCAGALLARVRGARRRAVLVACTRPMFWLCALRELEMPDGLRDARIATFPPVAPPWFLLRASLRARGLDPDADFIALPARDDVARLGMLRAGDVDLAVLSSAALPLAGYGLPLADGGDDGVASAPLPVVDLGETGVPSTGLAVSEAMLAREPETVHALVRAQRRALELMRTRPADAVAVLAETFGYRHQAAEAVHALVRDRFTAAGRIDPAAVQPAIDRFLAEVPDAAPVDAAAFYDCDRS